MTLRNILIAHVRAATPVESNSRSAWIAIWIAGSLAPWLFIVWWLT